MKPELIWEQALADRNKARGERYETQVLKQLGCRDLEAGLAGYNSLGGFMYRLAILPDKYHVLSLVKKPSVLIDCYIEATDMYGDHNVAVVFQSDMSKFTALTPHIFRPLDDFEWCISRTFRNQVYYLFDMKPFFKEKD